MLARLTPMPLAVAREPFDLEWIYEVKWDGFRALAYIEGHHCKLVSRKGREYNSRFYNLMFRREWPHFMAFDLLWLDGADLRQLPLHQRKPRLARRMPRVPSRVRLVEQLQGCGVDSSTSRVNTTSKASSRSGRTVRTRRPAERRG